MLKSNTNVSHSFALVVKASVSTDLVLSSLSSIFNLIFNPTAGEYTLTLIVVAEDVIGILLAKPAGVPMVVPAQVSAPFGLVVFFTLFELDVGSTASIVALLPKSVTA